MTSIPPSLIQAFPYPETPWRVTPGLEDRTDLKPYDLNHSFKLAVVLGTDPDLEPVKKYYFADKPKGKGIIRVYYIYNPSSLKAFEMGIKRIEVEAKNSVFHPKWSSEKGADERAKVISCWKNITDLFENIRLSDNDPLLRDAKVIPLWHGSDVNKCLSIASGGFTSFGKHHFFNPQTQKSNLNTDCGYFGSGIYFTDSARYAAMYNQELLLAFGAMRQPYPVINDVPHPSMGSDMKKLSTGLGAFENYNAHFVPVASIRPNDPNCMEYYPCYQGQPATFNEYVLFQSAQTIARFWVQLAPDGPLPALSLQYSAAECYIAAEQGDENQIKNWIVEDASRLRKLYEGRETLFYPALAGNHLSLMQWFHNQDPDVVNYCRDDGRSLSFQAVLAGKQEILHWLMSVSTKPYSAHQFSNEARAFGYSPQKIQASLQSVGWSSWTIPPRNVHFSGREDFLLELETMLQSMPATTFEQATIVGPGGIGKSAIALEYTHRHQERYTFTLWIDAKRTLIKDLKALGKNLGITNQNTPEDEALAKVIAYLEEHPGWLLVFDEAESPEGLKQYLPKRGGHIIITSRNNNDFGGKGFFVELLLLQESYELFETFTHQDNKETEALLFELQGHPLAITQAAAYISKTGISSAEYLASFKKNRQILLNSQPCPEDYGYSITNTLQLSIEIVKSRSPESLKILSLALFLAPYNIPISFFGFNDLETLLEPLFEQCLLALTSREEYVVSIHPLLQNILRDQLSLEEIKWVISQQNVIIRAWRKFQPANPETWDPAKKLLPHVEAFYNHLEAFGYKNADIFVEFRKLLQNCRCQLAQGNSVLYQSS